MQHLLEFPGLMGAFASVPLFAILVCGRLVSGKWFNRIPQAHLSFWFPAPARPRAGQ